MNNFKEKIGITYVDLKDAKKLLRIILREKLRLIKSGDFLILSTVWRDDYWAIRHYK